MKKLIRISLVCLMATVITKTSTAQQGLQLALNYNIATPLGSSFKDYVSKTSFRGLQGSVLYGTGNHFRFGVQSSYSDFDQKFGRQVYKSSDGSDVSAVLTNTVKIAPLLAKAEYSFLDKGLIKPYVGLGAGLNFVSYDQYLGAFKTGDHYTKPAFTGDAGVLVPFKRGSKYGFRLSTSYNLQPLKEQGIKNLDTWNVQAGFALPL